MADYYPLIARAIAGLDKNTGEARRALYERARTALVAQLRGINPPLQEAEITRERLALEEAVRKVEAEAARRSRIETTIPQQPPAVPPAPPAGPSAPSFPNAAPAAPKAPPRPPVAPAPRPPAGPTHPAAGAPIQGQPPRPTQPGTGVSSGSGPGSAPPRPPGAPRSSPFDAAPGA